MSKYWLLTIFVFLCNCGDDTPVPPTPAPVNQKLDGALYKIGHQKWVTTVLSNQTYSVHIDSCCENDTTIIIQKNSKDDEIECLSEMIDKHKEYLIQNPSDTK